MPPVRQSTATLPLPPAVFVALLALADADAHGYRLRAAIIERSNGAITLDPGSLYRLIARLVEDGLVAEAPETARPDDVDERRRYYRLTSTGRRVLKAETQRLADLVALSRATMAKAGRKA